MEVKHKSEFGEKNKIDKVNIHCNLETSETINEVD